MKAFRAGQIVDVWFPKGVSSDAYTGRISRWPSGAYKMTIVSYDEHDGEGVVFEHTNMDRPRFRVEFDENRQKLVSDGDPV